MKTKLRKSEITGGSHQGGDNGSSTVSSLIDVAFLLLIYFLVTSTLLPREGDLGLAMQDDENVFAIDIESIPVTVAPDGTYLLYGESVGSGPSAIEKLSARFREHKTVCETLDQTPVVLIDLQNGARHQDFIHVLNELTAVGITDILIKNDA